jgi:hypothetical protein
VPLGDASYYVSFVSIPWIDQWIGLLKEKIERSRKDIPMGKISFLAATFLVAICGVAKADALPPRHLEQFRHTSPTPPGEVRASAKSQWNGYVDYRDVGLSSNPDDCNKGCAVTNGP